MKGKEICIPVMPRRPGKYRLTDADKEYLKSLAVDGVIPLDVHIRAMNKILNGDITRVDI